MARIGAQVDFMISAGDRERLGDFARTGAKLAEIVNATASLHQFDSSPRLERTNQNKAVGVALHQNVQHPMNAVVEIHVRRACLVVLDKAARARARKSVRSFVVDCRIRFHFNDDARAFGPNQLSADKFARTRERIALEKRPANHLMYGVSTRSLISFSITYVSTN